MNLAFHRPGAVLALASLVLGLSACGGASSANSHTARSAAAPAHLKPSPPAAGAAARVDDHLDWKTARPEVSHEVVAKFGRGDVAAAYRQMTRFVEENSFREHLIRNSKQDNPPEYAQVRKRLSPSAQKSWDKVIHSDKANDQTTVQLMAFTGLVGRGLGYPKSGPTALNARINRVVIGYDEKVGDRIAMNIRTSGDVRLTLKDKPVTVNLTKNVTYWLEPVTSGGKTVWKIDGWRGSYTHQPPTPEASAR